MSHQILLCLEQLRHVQYKVRLCRIKYCHVSNSSMCRAKFGICHDKCFYVLKHVPHKLQMCRIKFCHVSNKVDTWGNVATTSTSVERWSATSVKLARNTKSLATNSNDVATNSKDVVSKSSKVTKKKPYKPKKTPKIKKRPLPSPTLTRKWPKIQKKHEKVFREPKRAREFNKGQKKPALNLETKEDILGMGDWFICHRQGTDSLFWQWSL